MSGLTDSQSKALVVTERVNSSVSVAGIIFIFVTYLFARGFDKPINRLIFFASLGNLGSNIAALISEAGPNAGEKTALCKFQAFLVQMFLGVDCYWAFCMAINVYLVFFRGYTVRQLRSLDIIYLLACYGLSLIPAFVFLWISTRERGPIYGPAVIWCWITEGWDFLRITFLYGIVWVACAFAFVVYGMAAKVIWNKRQHLDGFLNPLNENPFVNTITTDIEITTDERPIMKETHAPNRIEDTITDIDNPYSVQITVDQRKDSRPLPAALRMRSITRGLAEMESNAEAWLYARVAFLFFIALLITWIPSSVNRVYSIAYPTAMNFPLNYVASFVFPLQAFWNVIVYIVTSQAACRNLWRTLTFRSSSTSSAPRPPPAGGRDDPMGKPKRIRSIEGVGLSSSSSTTFEGDRKSSTGGTCDGQELQDIQYSSRWSMDSIGRR